MTYPLLDYAIAREAERAIAELELLRCLLAAPIAARNVRDAGLRESDIGQPDLRVMYGACLRCALKPRMEFAVEVASALQRGGHWDGKAIASERGMKWSPENLASFLSERCPVRTPIHLEVAALEAERIWAKKVIHLATLSREAERHWLHCAEILGCPKRQVNPIREARELVKVTRLTGVPMEFIRGEMELVAKRRTGRAA